MTILQDIQTSRFWRHFQLALFASVGGLPTIMRTFNVIYPGSHAMEGFGILIAIKELDRHPDDALINMPCVGTLNKLFSGVHALFARDKSVISRHLKKSLTEASCNVRQLLQKRQKLLLTGPGIGRPDRPRGAIA
ncbi:hypothetical protein QWI18_15820 [Pseudomonas sp. W2Oct36]|uniref:hypothetical protein n=1 Tax=Pseudomonas sp. W2Oct36 TaxID=1215284 RepID=UPI0034E0620E